MTLTRTPATDITPQDIFPLIGKTVLLTVHDGPRQIQNGPTHYLGTVTGFMQRDPNGRHGGAGDGELRGVGYWTKHDLVTIKSSRGDCRLQATGESGARLELDVLGAYTDRHGAHSYYGTGWGVGHRLPRRVVPQVPPPCPHG